MIKKNFNYKICLNFIDKYIYININTNLLI